MCPTVSILRMCTHTDFGFRLPATATMCCPKTILRAHSGINIDFNFNKDFDIGWVNGKPYEPHRIDQTLILGTAQSWRLSSSALSHPFHIHVNPFQIVSVKDKITKKQITTGE
jgi:FtsP/CotA-like multicopper oxidase with cupredoxin domain